MVKKSSASKSVSKVRSGVTNLVLQIQKGTKKSRERKIKILDFENEIKQQKEKLLENEKDCIFLRRTWLSTKHNLDKSNEVIFDLRKQIADMTSTKADVKLRVQNNVLVDDIQKRNEKTIKNAISNAQKRKTDPHRMQQRTKTLLKKSFHKKDITNWELVLKLYSCPTKSMRKLIMKK